MSSAKRSLLKLLLTVSLFSLVSPVNAATVNPSTSRKTASQWAYTRSLIINNPGQSQTNAVVKIQLSAGVFNYAKAAANGADIRFTTKHSGLNDAGLSYWIEKWNTADTSTIWVKIPNLAKGKNSLFLHYGNAEAKAQSNGDATFLFFDDFESDSYTKKWTNVSIGEVSQKDGVLKIKESDGQVGIITANFNVSGKMIIRARYQREGGDQHWTSAGIGGWNRFFCFGDHTEVDGIGTNWLMFYNWDSLNDIHTKPLAKTDNKKITDKWRSVAFWYDGSSIYGKQDYITLGLTASPDSSKLALRTLDNDAWDNFDYITVSTYYDAEPKVSIGKENKN